jgi:hypothetical protein
VRASAVIAVVALVVGCGGSRGAAPDGGARTESFDVVAAFSKLDALIPVTGQMDRFTIVLDRDAGQILVGGHGTASVVPVTTRDGRVFTVGGSFETATAPGLECSKDAGLHYDSVELVVDGATLSGHATGHVSCDCIALPDFEAELTGGLDRAPPTLLGRETAKNPFAFFSVEASEPLPLDATARVVDASGVSVALVPTLGVGPGGGRAVVGFQTPNLVLGAAGGYSVALGGLVDFAGNHGQTAALRLGAFEPAPLVPGDGFESAVGDTLGGAAILRAGGPGGDLAPVTGAQAVYLGRLGAPFVDVVHASPQLLVRMAVPTGATKLTYAYRVVMSAGAVELDGTLSIGSVGKSGRSVGFATPKNRHVIFSADGGGMYAGDVERGELTLPSDHGDELVVLVDTAVSLCVPSVAAPAAVLLDDLKVE